MDTTNEAVQKLRAQARENLCDHGQGPGGQEITNISPRRGLLQTPQQPIILCTKYRSAIATVAPASALGIMLYTPFTTC